jgi:hypothetical protein
MIRRLLVVLVLLSTLTISAWTPERLVQSASQGPCSQSHEDWVRQTLGKIETIKPGITVDFEAVGRPSRSADGRVTLVEDSLCVQRLLDRDFMHLGGPDPLPVDLGGGGALLGEDRQRLVHHAAQRGFRHAREMFGEDAAVVQVGSVLGPAKAKDPVVR